MWESKYGNEPADLKLLVLRFSRKIWIFLLAVIAGSTVTGALYFVQHVVLAPAPEYVAHSMMYVDFVRGEGREPKYYTFNTAGWSGFVKTDEILDKAVEQLKTNEEAQKLEMPISKEEMRACVDASVDADYRVVDLLVTSTDPERAVIIAHAVEAAFPVFGDSMQEIEQVRVMTSADTATRVWVDTATYRAFIWGGILAGVIVFLVLLVRLILDEAVYVPETLRRRYGFPVLGVAFDKESTDTFAMKQQEQLKQNIAYFCKEDSYYRLAVGQRENILQHPEEMSKIKDATGVVLEIPAGVQNGKIVEETIGQLQQHDIKIYGMVLVQTKERLLKAYYSPLWIEKKKERHGC